MDMKAFAAMAALMSGGKDEGSMMPISDATDFQNGARYIPSDVTIARREGKRVNFDAENHEWTIVETGEVIR